MATFKSLIYIFIFLIFITFKTIKSDEDIFNLDLDIFVSFILLNDNIIICSNKGFFTFDSNFNSLYNYTFSTELTLDNNEYKYPSFTQFPEEEGGYIICYILKNIYIFDKTGKFIFLNDAGETSFISDRVNNYIINAFKYKNDEYYYTIITADFLLYYGSLYMFYYKIDLSNNNKSLLYNNTYSNSSEQFFEHNAICCEKMITHNNDNYITCLYQYEKHTSLVIGEISFEPDKNFSYIEPRKFLNLIDYINVFQYPSSVTNEDKSKVYVCFSAESTNASCFYYDINTREFSKILYFGYQCKKDFYFINLNYFRKSKEFIFSCVSVNLVYSIVKFNQNISLIQPNSFGLYNATNICFNIHSFSIFYSLQDNEYIIFSSSECYLKPNIHLYKYNLTNFFNTTNNIELNNDSIIKETNSIINPSIKITESMISPFSKITESTMISPSTEITQSTGISLSNKIIKSTKICTSTKITGSSSTKLTESTKISLPTKIIKSTQIIIPETSLLTEFNKPKETALTNEINIIEIIDSNQINHLKGGCNDYKKIINENNECVCDNINGYYSLNINNISDDNCYNEKTKPINFYLNKQTKQYEICHRNCLTCNNNGNENENNCTSCVNNYIFTPDINNTVNCVPQCKYLYYFNSYGFYSCSKNYQCPIEAYLLIRNKNKCIDKCFKDNIYKYQYSGECYEKCPDETNTNGYKCEVKNINSCSISNFQLNITIDDIIENNIDSYTKNYVYEFNYTYKQVINYKNNDYSLVLYKNSSCIKELSLTVPQIDFGECYSKIKIEYNISEDLLIAILDKYVENSNPITSYLFFNPINGERIDVNKICKNYTIIMKENILTLPGVDPDLIQFFADQDINVFNLSDKFYTDICKHYISPNDRDIPLNLRIKIFYPNVSLCDGNCINKGVDLKTMESICYCPFNDLSKNSFLENTLKYTENFDEIYSFISNSNINVLFCIKVIFQIAHLKRCIGGLIILVLMILQTICVIIYKYKSIKYLKKYILNLSNKYKQSLLNLKNASPIKKKIKKVNIINKTKSNINLYFNSSNNNTYLSKYTNKIIINNSPKKNNIKSDDNNSRIYFGEYLSTDPNEMDYDDVIEKDNRTFFQYFIETIKKKQLIINTFFIVDNIKPKTIKIISFLLKLDFYLLFNGMIYNEEFLIKLYENNNGNSFINFVSRYFQHLLYIFIIIKILDKFIECFFIEEKRLKGIFIRGKNKIKKIKENLLILIKKIEKYYFIFIIVTYIITFLSMIYVSCFNDVYYYSRIDWVKSSLFCFIVIQFISVFIILFETIIRYLGIKCKNEKLFRISKFII